MSAAPLELFPLILGYGALVFLVGTLAVMAGFFGLYLFARLTEPLHRREVEQSLRARQEVEKRYGTA